jgi:hypothetical protein
MRLAGRPSYDRPAQIRILGRPEPGYFVVRLVKRGPLVPCLIWRPCPWVNPEPLQDTPAVEQWCMAAERSRPLRARIGQQEASVAEVWERGRRVSAQEYALRLEKTDWAARYAPHEPEANPAERVDMATQPSLF